MQRHIDIDIAIQILIYMYMYVYDVHLYIYILFKTWDMGISGLTIHRIQTLPGVDQSKMKFHPYRNRKQSNLIQVCTAQGGGGNFKDRKPIGGRLL